MNSIIILAAVGALGRPLLPPPPPITPRYTPPPERVYVRPGPNPGEYYYESNRDYPTVIPGYPTVPPFNYGNLWGGSSDGR
jgi:hypothetical protein